MMDDEVSGDSVLFRELKALREELSTTQPERLSRAAERAPATAKTSEASDEPSSTAIDPSLEGELTELVEAIKGFAEEAERNVAAHPTATAIGAMAVGILIGRLLGRR